MKMALLILSLLPTMVLANCADNELYQKLKNLNCPSKSIHLTFDDGPRAATTPLILEELKKRKIKATFFVSTTNLEKSVENRKIVNDLMNAGQFIASHGHDHHNYDCRYGADKKPLSTPFTQKEREAQIKKSDELLNLATNGKFSKQKQGKFFRFPYGRGAMPSPYEIEVMIQQGMTIKGNTYAEKLSYYRSHSPAMSTLSESDYNHMGWNFDSQDSSLGAEISDPATVEKYLTENLTRMCASSEKILIALFHDIKKLNVKAIGPFIDTAQCFGMKFIDIDETLTKRKELVKSGVIINKYELNKEDVGELLGQLSKVNEKPILSCEPAATKEKKGCYSEYTGKEIPHCQGADSICVDGKFYAKGSLVPHTECGHALEASATKIEINQQKCSTPSEAKVIVPNSIKCYCQENDKKELRWNCYDISEVPARKI
jgi:peptidoglycan/xylan/chitin deacetylase (PgdA/CDA1 family)